MYKLSVLFIALLFWRVGFGQYILNGSAQKNSCNCYTLTQAIQTQTGSVWNSKKIDLTSSFDFWFNVNLGCSDGGADGIVFMLQPISTSVGTSGEGMGFAGVSPSIGIALDTYQNLNLNDPFFDHISIQSNGQINHSTDLAGPVPISPTSFNVEDCQWHRLRITWDAGTKWLRTYFDGVLRVEKQIDLVTTIFNNDPSVYWGFTGATGGQVNLQQFCTALDPAFTTDAVANIACTGAAVHFTNASESFAPITDYNWSFGDGGSSSLMNPSHTYAASGRYPVTLKIKGLDGCENDSTISVVVGAIPAANLTAFDTCSQQQPRIGLISDTIGVNYLWRVDGTSYLTGQPSLNNLVVGSHTVDVIAFSPANCGPADTASASFIIKPVPQVEAVTPNGCIRESLLFNGVQLDVNTIINQWAWNFGDGSVGFNQHTSHQYLDSGLYGIKLWAIATNGCSSDTVEKTVTVNKAIVFAGHDTVVVRNLPFQLGGEGNGSFSWSPGFGLSNSDIANPTVTLHADQQFVLTVTTTEGCTSSDSVLIKVYDGPTVYVPSAFTPNGDGKNDLLLPVYVGIKQLNHFSVFNRWGEKVFTTTNMFKGWDGGNIQSGTFVWMVRAVNYLGQAVILKGTVTVIR